MRQARSDSGLTLLEGAVSIALLSIATASMAEVIIPMYTVLVQGNAAADPR